MNKPYNFVNETVQKPGQESVNSPAHYTQGYIETIYAIAQTLGPEGFKAYCMGNWMKYNARAAYKNGAEDLAKAAVYLNWAQNGLPFPKLIETRPAPKTLSEAHLIGAPTIGEALIGRMAKRKFWYGDCIRPSLDSEARDYSRYIVEAIGPEGYRVQSHKIEITIPFNLESEWELCPCES